MDQGGNATGLMGGLLLLGLHPCTTQSTQASQGESMTYCTTCAVFACAVSIPSKQLDVCCLQHDVTDSSCLDHTRHVI